MRENLLQLLESSGGDLTTETILLRIGQPARETGTPEGENPTEADNTRKKGHKKEESEP